MANSSKRDLEKIDRVSQAWSKLRPGKPFGGLTLEQYLAAVQPSRDVRAEMAEAELRVQSCAARRITADRISLQVTDRVINAVKSDPEEGDDSDVYEAMGFVRKSNRGSGLTRRRKAGPIANGLDTSEGAAKSEANS